MSYGNQTLERMARVAMTAVLAASIVACGGGGGGGGTPLSGSGSGAGTGTGTGTATGSGTSTGADTGSGTGTTTPAAASLLVAPSKTSVNNGGGDTSTLVVTAVDSAGNALSGVAVNVAVNNNSVYTRGSTNVTGSDGTVTGVLSIGGDKTNRLVTYTVTSGTVSKVGTIAITGTTVTGIAVPAVPTPGQSVALTVTVADSAGVGIASVPVSLSGITGVTLPAQNTDSAGKTIFRFVAPATAGSYPLSIDANNASTQTVPLVVAATGNSAIPTAVGPIVSQSVLANPVVVAANVVGSSIKQSEVRALFLTSANVALPNMRVRFRVMSSILTGESLVSGSTTVYSDVTGVAKTSYVAPTVGSPTGGVRIRACYGLDDSFNFDACFALTNDSNGRPTGQYVETTLTVTASPVSLTIGSDNVIEKTTSSISYVKKFEIQAVDAAGNYAPNVQLSAVVDTEGYWKGADMVPLQTSKTITDIFNTATPPVMVYKFCLNEDVNRNNALDTGEDTNGDGALTPRKSDVSVGFVNGVSTTDSTGLALLQLTYPQNVATWERVKITVTAGVSGSEGAATYVYQLTPAEADVANGAFRIAPYGTALSCTTPN